MLSEILQRVPQSIKAATFEVRLRLGGPLALTCPGRFWFVDAKSQLHNLPKHGYCITREEIDDSVLAMCSDSVHSHQQEFANGFISLRGGHRAGICGTAVLGEGQVSAVRDITSVNLRIARDMQGIATPLIRDVFAKQLCGLLIVGPPTSGKTTLLRDLARQLSNGEAGQYIKVAVVDERCELAAVSDGIPQNDLGAGCDILSGYPKGQGIALAVRTLSPHVIICDEIGGRQEADSMLDGINGGVQMIATAHATSWGELSRRPHIMRLLEYGAFQKIVWLEGGDNPGQIREIMEVGERWDEGSRHGAYRSLLLDDGEFHGVRIVQTSGAH